MTNAEIKNIIGEEIAAAQIPENMSIKVFFNGNGARIRTFERSLCGQPYDVKIGEVSTVKHTPHYEVSQIGWGQMVWGIQGPQRIRELVRAYLAAVAC